MYTWEHFELEYFNGLFKYFYICVKMKINTESPSHLLLSLSDTAVNTELEQNDKRHIMLQWA